MSAAGFTERFMSKYNTVLATKTTPTVRMKYSITSKPVRSTAHRQDMCWLSATFSDTSRQAARTQKNAASDITTTAWPTMSGLVTTHNIAIQACPEDRKRLKTWNQSGIAASVKRSETALRAASESGTS